MLVLVNGARGTISAKVGVRAKSEGVKEGVGVFTCPNLRAAKNRKRHSDVRKILRTYRMETLATQAKVSVNVSVNSKRDHPPPRATPGHLTPVQLHIVGHLTRRSPTHRAFDPSKKCWSSVAREKHFADKILNFQDLAGKILNFQNLAGKILNFQHLAGQDLEFSRSCRQDLEFSGSCLPWVPEVCLARFPVSAMPLL